ncbi:MAG: hypothetical protein ACKO3P_20025, partial [Planctomycetaceae bacterium]
MGSPPMQPPTAGNDAGQDWSECPACEGGRLNAAARAWRWRGQTLPAWLAKPAHTLGAELRQVPPPVQAETPGEPSASAPSELWRRIGPELLERCDLLVELGLGHWPLRTPLCELTASESQRARLAGVLATELVHLLFVLEEPSAGLLPEQWPALIRRLRALTQQGNSVVVIEHHPEWLAACDWVVELGPGAGANGGQIMAIHSPETSALPLTSPVHAAPTGRRPGSAGDGLAPQPPSKLQRGTDPRGRSGKAVSGRQSSAGQATGFKRGVLTLPDLGAGSPELPLGGLTLVQGLAATAARPLWLRGLDQVLAANPSR